MILKTIFDYFVLLSLNIYQEGVALNDENSFADQDSILKYLTYSASMSARLMSLMLFLLAELSPTDMMMKGVKWWLLIVTHVGISRLQNYLDYTEHSLLLTDCSTTDSTCFTSVLYKL